jgi:hypothetical protein
MPAARSGLATETTLNSYDQLREGVFNLGKLTTARRDVAAQTVAGASLPVVASVKTYDYDLAGRPVKETHFGIHGADRVLEDSLTVHSITNVDSNI